MLTGAKMEWYYYCYSTCRKKGSDLPGGERWGGCRFKRSWWEFGLRSLQFSPSLAWVPGSDSLQAGSQALNGGMCEAFSFHMLLSRAQRIAWTQAAPLSLRCID
ncbi:Hypothetical predicted protein [Podarcis lilfordi]|uniref:Uncharacterized protein n=1 Tax=Podarcis lilfordi TaxID=74358 RepID=A0AA35JX19_9SAUR|nr:Hypothetical predicted protein [Podarcis lilfordi]